MEKVTFLGLQNCYRVFNDAIDLIVTTEIGPKIIRFGFIGDRNEFLDKTSGGFTGHILRHAPESQDRTFFGNKPVKIKEYQKFIRFTEATEKKTGIQKEMVIPLSIEGNHISIVHRLYNRGVWPIEIAPWTSTMMPPVGKAILPLPPRKPHGKNTLLPTSSISIWAYCDLLDPRLVLGKKYVMLKQDGKTAGSYKLGMLVSDGWTAYYNDHHLFVVTFDFIKGATYPDLGCSVEACTFKFGHAALELETLGPLALLQPGTSVKYTENWFLFRDIADVRNDNDIDKYVLPLVREIK